MNGKEAEEEESQGWQGRQGPACGSEQGQEEVRRVLNWARLSLFLVLANMVFLGASLAAETKTAPSDLKCAAVNDVVNDLQAKIPDVEIDFLDQLHALMFLSGLKDLAKAEVQTPPMAITGAMLVHAPGDKGVVLGILVGKTICEYTAMPIELAIAVLKHGTES